MKGKDLRKGTGCMVIFLDVDGVLNRERDWVCKYAIHEPCLLALSMIADKIRCNSIVLASTWRACEGNAEPEFYKNLKTHLREYGLTVTGTIPISKHTRKEEIQYYAKRHECGKYLVIDDDPSLFPDSSGIPLYICNYKTGLTLADVNGAYKVCKKHWRCGIFL